MKPLPRITPDSKPFWDALRDRRLMLPHCTQCGKPHLPPGPVCPFCFAEHLEWRQASGRGRISTFTVVHKAWFPDFAAEIPYNVVQVELEEGPRLTTSIVRVANDELKVGMPVIIDFQDPTLPRFRPA